MRSQRRLPAMSLVWALALATLALLLAVMRVWAMPQVVDQTTVWYDYQASVGFDWTAQVTPGHYYAEATIRPETLIQQKLPVEPPQFRRVLLAPLAQTVTVRMPYSFKADRQADLSLSLQVETVLQIPGYWQQTKKVVPLKTWQVIDQSVAGEATFTLSLDELKAELERQRTDLGFVVEPLEVQIHPLWQIKAAGMREPVEVQNAPTYRLLYRSSAIEIDEPKTDAIGHSLTFREPIAQHIALGSRLLSVRWAQGVSLILLGLFGALLAYLLWRLLSRRKKALGDLLWLRRLQPFVIRVVDFQVPPEVALVWVDAPRELARLQVQTSQTIIQMGDHLYLKDGSTCYAYHLGRSQAANPIAQAAAGADDSAAVPQSPIE
jgi:hypothetical protein